MNYLEYLIKYWSQVTVVIFAIGYLLKVIFEFKIKKEEIKFDFIHKERAAVIKQLHLDLTHLSKDISLMYMAHELKAINQGPTNEERKKLFHQIVKLNGKIYDTITLNKIYFPETFFSQFDNLFKNVNDNFILTSLDKNVLLNDENNEYIFNDSQKFLNYFKNEFHKLTDKLQKEFERYL